VLTLLVVAAIAVGLVGRGRGGSRFARTGSVPSQEKRAEEGLTLLDVWSQTVVPYISLQQARAQAAHTGDVARAARLARQLGPGLLAIERFAPDAAEDPILRNDNSIEGRAVRAAGAAWGDWASALLWRPSSPRTMWTRQLAALRARAIRLQQDAYSAVDASFRTAFHT
jgi:hypothetical protein